MNASKMIIAAVAFVMSNIALVLCVSFFAIPVSGGVTINAHKQYILSGQVVNAQGQPVANARVKIINGSDMMQYNRGYSRNIGSGSKAGATKVDTTNQKGQFTIGGLLTGTYSKKVQAEGYKTLKGNVTMTQNKTITITLHPSQK